MITKESPLKGMQLGNTSSVAIYELPLLNTLDLRIPPVKATQAAVAKALDMKLPEKTGQTCTCITSACENAHVLCLAPDWFLIIGYAKAEEKLIDLKEHYHISVVNVSSQRTTIQLEGFHVRNLLVHLWEQDIRVSWFPVGAVSQGLMAKAPVILFHIAPLRYRILVRSSFAMHVWKALEDAAQEYL
jgi:sarcosine oxidase, subunit gamma